MVRGGKRGTDVNYKEKSNLCRVEKWKKLDIIHYFLMHIVLHSYIIARTLTGDWPNFKVLAVVCGGVGEM